MTVSFSKANTKLEELYHVPELQEYLEGKRKVYSFDLISGWSCPQAKDCLSKVVKIGESRKIKDGKDCQFRCFSASQEALFPDTYAKRKRNFDALRSLKTSHDMANAIVDAMPKNLGICRIHVAGDFFNEEYFKAWQAVAYTNPTRLFYAYTKSLNYWVKLRDHLPANFVLTASRGGRLDHLIDEHNLREARVVFSEAEADALRWDIDHTDEHAAIPDMRDDSFALLIHGTQPKGSEASKAIKALKASKTKFSYGRKSAKAGV
jgi:hypothetical protein